jgi:phosphopantetheinyl transferase
VDVEHADGGEIPWLALHPGERAFLNQLEGRDQGLAFARLWSLKEAYVKAQGLGFRRPPDGFEVRLEEDGTAAIDDPAPAQPVALVLTRWRETPEGLAAISVVVLEAGEVGAGPCALQKPPSPP